MKSTEPLPAAAIPPAASKTKGKPEKEQKSDDSEQQPAAQQQLQKPSSPTLALASAAKDALPSSPAKPQQQATQKAPKITPPKPQIKVDETLRKKVDGFINFWLDFYECEFWCELLPVAVKTDGNCLLHSVSMFINGHDDSDLSLREGLYNFMVNNPDLMKIFIQYEKERTKNLGSFGFDRTEEQFKSEWSDLLDNVKIANSNYQKSLESIHVFALANYIKMPIIIYSKPQVCKSNIPNIPDMDLLDLGGIYLPNLDKHHGKSNPVILAYDCGHFAPLFKNSRYPQANQVLITRKNNKCLPIHYKAADTNNGKYELDLFVQFLFFFLTIFYFLT